MTKFSNEKLFPQSPNFKNFQHPLGWQEIEKIAPEIKNRTNQILTI